MSIRYKSGIINRLRDYENYLVSPPQGEEQKFQTSKARARGKFLGIINYINQELSKPKPYLYKCNYKKFRGDTLNRKMLKYHDSKTPKTIWCISVAVEENGDYTIWGIEQDKVLASIDIREQRKMLSLVQYITEHQN